MWAKELAPSDHLRKWFSHDPEKWSEFKELYREELCDPSRIEMIQSIRKHNIITLLFSSKETASRTPITQSFRNECRSILGID